MNIVEIIGDLLVEYKTIIGMLLISLISWAYNHNRFLKERKDRYRLASIEKKIIALSMFIDFMDTFIDESNSGLELGGNFRALLMPWYRNESMFLSPKIAKKMRDIVYELVPVSLSNLTSSYETL